MANERTQVLVIDDDNDDTFLTRRALEKAGGSSYEVHCAVSLKEAVKKMRSQSCDLVLLDLGLPESIGLNTLRDFQAACDNNQPIIVLTGLSDEAVALKALDEGALDYLIKGEVNSDTLSRSIRYSLQRHQLRSELEEANNNLEARVADRTSQLAASEANYHELYDNTPDMLVSVDAKNQAIIHCNRTLSLSLGYGIGELEGRDASVLYHPNNQADLVRILQELKGTGEIRDYESIFYRNDGAAIDVSINVSAVYDDNGKILHGRFACRNITDRNRIEQELQQKNRDLAHVSRLATMGEMASGIAHELNQPLHAINNYACGAVSRLNQGWLDKDSLTSVFEDIAAEAKRAGDIIHGIRRYVGKRAEKRESIPASQLAETVVKTIGPEAKRREVDLQVVICENLSVVRCDQVQIEQVLMNLLLNALDAMNEVSAERRRVVFTVKAVPRAIEFSVCDSGCGIPSEVLEQLFDPYFTTKQEGLGMGLSIARTIAEAHNGFLKASSNPDCGATMALTLPSLSEDAG